MTPSLVHDFIKARRLGVLGSISPQGIPQAALVGVGITPRLEVVFDTVNSSRKYRNLVANPRCSFVIGWDAETTVQYEGEAHQPVGSELSRAQEAYFETWPEGPERMAWPGITYFLVSPNWIRYTDYDQSPPFIEEVDLAGMTASQA